MVLFFFFWPQIFFFLPRRNVFDQAKSCYPSSIQRFYYERLLNASFLSLDDRSLPAIVHVPLEAWQSALGFCDDFFRKLMGRGLKFFDGFYLEFLLTAYDHTLNYFFHFYRSCFLYQYIWEIHIWLIRDDGCSPSLDLSNRIAGLFQLPWHMPHLLNLFRKQLLLHIEARQMSVSEHDAVLISPSSFFECIQHRFYYQSGFHKLYTYSFMRAILTNSQCRRVS